MGRFKYIGRRMPNACSVTASQLRIISFLLPLQVRLFFHRRL